MSVSFIFICKYFVNTSESATFSVDRILVISSDSNLQKPKPCIMSVDTKKIRNVVLLGHSGSGKTSFAETMRITGTGKVGIGGITPTGYQLHVLGWPNSKLLQLENTDILDAGINNTIMFQTGGKYTGAIKTIGINNNEASLGFYTGTSATETGLLRRMTIANSGNIGIGTFAPIAKLHIEDLTNTTSKTPFFILTQSGGQTQHYIELGTTTNVTNKAGLFSSFGNSHSYGVDASGDGTAFTAGVYASSQTVSGIDCIFQIYFLSGYSLTNQ